MSINNQVKQELLSVITQLDPNYKGLQMFEVRKKISISKQVFDENFLSLLKDGVIEIPSTGIWANFPKTEDKLVSIGVIDPKNKKNLFTEVKLNRTYHPKQINLQEIRTKIPKVSTPKNIAYPVPISKTTDMDIKINILDAIESLQSAVGNYVAVYKIRIHIGETNKKVFDEAVIDLADEGKVIMTSYDGPRTADIKQKMKEDLVEDSRGELFIGIALPRNGE